MDSFTLDDVRDSFAADVGGATDRIALATALVGGHPWFGDAPCEADGGDPLATIAHAAHAIAGTAGLVHIRSLASSAKALEQLAESAAEDLALARTALRRVAAANVICEDAVPVFNRLLDLVLAGRMDEADALAEPLRQQIDAWPPVEPLGDGSLRDEADGMIPEPGSDGTAVGADLGMDEGSTSPIADLPVSPGEPSGAFQFEAVAEALSGGAPVDPDAAAATAFHFDDAAAAVESEPAASTDPPAIGSAAFSFDDPAEADPADGFSFDAPPAEDVAVPPADELAEVFREELAALVPELAAAFAGITGERTDRAAIHRLERLFHTIKGAAATVGLGEISRLAAGLEDRSEALGGTRTASLAARPGDPQAAPTAARICDLARGAAEILRQSGLAPLVADLGVEHLLAGSAPRDLAGASATPRPQPVAQQLLQVFAQEACAAAARIGRLVPPEDIPARAELARLAHQLKGSATVTGQQAIAVLASALQDAAASERPAADEALDLFAAIRDLGLSAGLPVAELPPPSDPLATPVVSLAHDERPRTDAIARERVESQRLARGDGSDAHASGAPLTMPRGIDPILWEAFEVESAELLESVDSALVRLIDAAEPQRCVQELMRLVHTLKGTANTVGLAPLGRYLHGLEDALDLLGHTSTVPVRPLAACISRAMAQVRAALAGIQGEAVVLDPALLAEDLRCVVTGAPPPRSLRTTTSRNRPGTDLQGSTARIGSAGHHGSDGRGSGSASSAGSDRPAAGERRFVRVAAARLDGLMNLAGELVVGRARLKRRLDLVRGLGRDLEERKERLLGTVGGFRSRHEFTLLKDHGPTVGRSGGKPAPASAAPVTPTGGESGFSDLELDRYDDLNVLSRGLGELGDDIAELHHGLDRACTDLTEDLAAFGRHISTLQGEITRCRLVPLDALFARLRLSAEEAAAREARQVRIELTGGEAALDKTIADRLHTPLLHLVRNALAHGIEPADERAAAGKPAAGLVRLAARQESGQVVVVIEDDGRGLDLERLRQLGIQRGLLPGDVALDDPRVREVVFAPGLSTRDVAGDVAGRGVGCDAARREVERLGGHVRVASIAGQGTVFTVTLPLTLAITRALLVRAAGATFAVPLAFAERISDLAGATLVEAAGRTRLRLDDGLVSLRPLAEVLGRPAGTDASAPSQIIVLRVGEARTALAVDQVLGQDEIVVKRLDQVLAGHPLFSGVTVDAEGRPVLILDAPGLVSATGGRRAAATVPAPGQAPAGIAHRPAVDSERKRRVLFVDDSLSVRKVAERILTGLGVEPVLAVDGEDALVKLRAGGIDLVFTDLEMPRLHGFDLIREIRFVPAWSGLPVIVVTSRSGQKHRDQAAALGATGYLTKPFAPEAIAEALAGILV